MPNEIYLDSWGNPQVGDPKELDKIKHEKFIKAAYEHMEYLLEAKRKDPNDDFYKGLVDSFSVKKKKSFVDYDGYETEFKGGQPLKHL